MTTAQTLECSAPRHIIYLPMRSLTRR